jgi:hypothetical protein
MTRGDMHFAAWPLLALAASALLGLGAAGCGGGGDAGMSSRSTGAVRTYVNTLTTSTIPPGQRVRGDGDADNPGDIDGNGDSDSASVGGADTDSDSPTPASYDFPDGDDRTTFAYGHPASPAAEHAIAGVVGRYYAAAAVDDGTTACSLLLPSLARSVPETYGGPGGPPYLRGIRTCQAVLAKLFLHFHRELARAATVVEVRVKGATARAVLGSETMRASSVFLTRQGGSWKITTPLGEPLP